MTLYHFTIHAYRSWGSDHPRGYTKKGEGYQRPNVELAVQYDENSEQPAVLFDVKTQQQILFVTHEICEREGWTLEAAGFDETHTHLIVGWEGFIAWEEVDRRLKNLLALKLNRFNGTPAKRWFTRRHGAPRRVENDAHFEHLLKTYLPDHRGVFWKRGMALPMLST